MKTEELIIKGFISELPVQEQAKIADAMKALRMWVQEYPDYAAICLALVVPDIAKE